MCITPPSLFSPAVRSGNPGSPAVVLFVGGFAKRLELRLLTIELSCSGARQRDHVLITDIRLAVGAHVAIFDAAVGAHLAE